MISIIAAVSEDFGIGKDNRLLWNIPEDLKRFKKLTTGKCVIMGKKTWESLPVKPLPARKNIVITDNPADRFNCDYTVFSVEEALEACKGEEEVFVIGGGSIYRQFMPLADRLYITHVHDKTAADTYFPEIDTSIWEIVSEEYHEELPGSYPPYTYKIYRRK